MVMRVKSQTNVPVLRLLYAALVLALSVPVFAGAEPQTDTVALTANTPAAAAPTAPGQPSEMLKEALDSPISIEHEIELENEHVSRILGWIDEYVGVNFVVDYRVVQPLPLGLGVPPEEQPAETRVPEELGYVTDGMVPCINLKDVPLRDVLKALCKPLNLTYIACPEYIWISTEDMIAKTDFGDPSAEADSEIARTLEGPCSLKFRDQHISRILEFVSEFFNVNIVLNKNAVPPPHPPSTSPGSPQWHPHKVLTDDGPQLTGRVPYIKLYDVPLNEALKALLLPLNLTYRVGPGYIYVTAPETK